MKGTAVGLELDVLVIGAGVVGLSAALHLKRDGRSVGVVERHAKPGRETSSRNSGVIHAGLYYPKGSLKATLCVEGRDRLYHWCRAHDVPHERCGKLLVATNADERVTLEALATRGKHNGAGPLQALTQSELTSREPTLRGVAALWSPMSGVVDAEAFVSSLRREAVRRGVVFGWMNEASALRWEGSRWRVSTRSEGRAQGDVHACWVVNAAGLTADAIAEQAGVDLEQAGWRQRWVKGDYYALNPKAPMPRARLVYPLPAPGLKGLGIHLTRSLGERTLAGPDAEDVDMINYGVDEDKAAAFAASLRPWLPGIEAHHLSPDFSGVRPKLRASEGEFADFVIARADEHGAPHFMHLGGIESPGLTASLAIGARVSRLLEA